MGTPPVDIIMGPKSVLALVGALSLFALLTQSVLKFLLASFGVRLRDRSAAKRKLLLEAAVAEEEFASRRRTDKAEDEDWERVEGYAAASAENGAPMPESDFSGIVGFFHPFW